MDNKLYTTISNYIEENRNKYSSNEIFGLLSMLVLLEITEIFQLDYSRLPERHQELPAPAGINNPANLITLLSQLQGGAEGNNLKQLLPLLLTALGGSNRNNMDLNQISDLLNTLKSNREKNSDEEIKLIEDREEEGTGDSKKKIAGR